MTPWWLRYGLVCKRRYAHESAENVYEEAPLESPFENTGGAQKYVLVPSGRTRLFETSRTTCSVLPQAPQQAQHAHLQSGGVPLTQPYIS